MLSAASSKFRDAALRVLAVAGTALTFGGRYHELNPVVDRGLALALRPWPARERGARSTVEHWETARRAAPDLAICHHQLAGALRKSGLFDRAGEVLADAFARFPDDLGTTLEAARLAERRSDHAEAARHWQKVVGMGRPRAPWIAGAAHSLIQLGRVDEAEALLDGASATHPALMAARCTLAARKREWTKAVSLSRAFRRRHPRHANSRALLGESIYAEMLSKLDDDGSATPPPAPAKVGKVKDEEARQLLLGFENIGENCEFALVQRRFGAEPVGLFRWNRIDAEDLVAALDHRLEGLGEPEHTELILTKNEYFVLDRRWFLGMHTFLYADQTTPDELMAAILRRTAALKERFVNDLAAGEKTFVFLSSGLPRRTVLDLHRALGAFGPVRLLAVQPAEAGAAAEFRGRPGDIVEVEPDCYVGFLRRRGGAADQSWDIAFDDWLSICRKVEARARARARLEVAAQTATSR